MPNRKINRTSNFAWILAFTTGVGALTLAISRKSQKNAKQMEEVPITLTVTSSGTNIYKIVATPDTAYAPAGTLVEWEMAPSSPSGSFVVVFKPSATMLFERWKIYQGSESEPVSDIVVDPSDHAYEYTIFWTDGTHLAYGDPKIVTTNGQARGGTSV